MTLINNIYCSACSTEYLVTETGDNELIIQAEIKENYQEE